MLQAWWRSVVVVAVCTQDLVAVGEEAGAHQRHRAARTLEARLVPLPVLKRHVLPVSKPCDGRVAAGALLGVQAAETLDAVRTLPLRGEGLASQWSFAARAEKTLFVPHVVLVGHPSFSQSLFAVAALRSDSTLVARHTEVVVVVWDERLGTYRLVAAVTHKTVLVPRGTAVLQHPRAWHDSLVAGDTLGGVLAAVAVAAHQRILLAGEGLVCQRAVAAETAETVSMVVSVLIEELLGIMADDFFTFLAGVGVQAVVAGDAVRLVLHLDVFASAQGLVAVSAVELVTHDSGCLCAPAACGDPLWSLCRISAAAVGPLLQLRCMK